MACAITYSFTGNSSRNNLSIVLEVRRKLLNGVAVVSVSVSLSELPIVLLLRGCGLFIMSTCCCSALVRRLIV